MIQPKVCRLVEYRPAGASLEDQPHAAIVIYVHNERSVNLACFSPIGTYYHREDVQLLQDDDAAPEGGGYAEWMAFQKGQAVKLEATEGQLHARVAALEEVLTAGGPIHTLVAGMQADVDTKFEELGDWLTAKFSDFDQKLGAPAFVPPLAPPANQPQTTADPAANAGQAAPNPPQPDLSGAGQAPQVAASAPGAAPQAQA